MVPPSVYDSVNTVFALMILKTCNSPTAVYFSRTLNTHFRPMSIWFCRGVNRVPGALNRMTFEPCFRPASTTPPGFGQLQSAGHLIVC